MTDQKYPLMPLPKGGDLVVKEDYVHDAQIEASDFFVPALKLLQGGSDEVKSGKAKPRRFWNPYTNQELTTPQEVIVCFHMKTRYKKERPKDLPPTEQCMSFDMLTGTRYGECKLCQYKEWGHDRGAAPSCSLSQCFVLCTADGPLMLRFRKKAEKYAKQFLTQKQLSQQNWWAFHCVIDIRDEVGVDESGKPAPYYAPTITWDKTKVVPEEIRVKARQYNAQLAEAQAAGRLKGDAVEEDSPT